MRSRQQVGGNDNFPDAPLTIVAPGEESGHLRLVHLAGRDRGSGLADGVPEDKAASLRPDYQSSPDDNVIIQGIEGSDSALGFVGFAYADQQGDNVKKLQVDGGDGCVEPSAETIADGTYPLSRSLYIYVNTDKLATNPALEAFVDYYLSDAGIASVTDADYVAIPQERLDASRAAWQAAAGGGSRQRYPSGVPFGRKGCPCSATGHDRPARPRGRESEHMASRRP